MFNPANPNPMFDEDGEIINEPKAIFPVLLLEIEDDDEGWDQGWRYQIEQLDEHAHYFHTIERASDFIVREGMHVITIPKMKKLREAGVTY